MNAHWSAAPAYSHIRDHAPIPAAVSYVASALIRAAAPVVSHRLSPGLAHYNCPLVFDIEGPLDLEVLRAALAEIVRRHEPLRTVFADGDGVPAQRVLALERFDLPCTDFRIFPLTSASRSSTPRSHRKLAGRSISKPGR